MCQCVSFQALYVLTSQILTKTLWDSSKFLKVWLASALCRSLLQTEIWGPQLKPSESAAPGVEAKQSEFL